MSRIVSILSLSLVMCFGAWALGAAHEHGQSKTGPIKSVDAKAKTFVLALQARPLTFTVTDKTTITLDGKESSFDAAIKERNNATVMYTIDGEKRVASKVEVKTKKGE